MTGDRKALDEERRFHDQWASRIDLTTIDVLTAFEGSTAPENRFILARLGDLRNKEILDLGCGAGESSVYFALKGARCVASDYSPGMLQAARRLAEKYKVRIVTTRLDAMCIDFPADTFDIVYAANLLHHVNTEKALVEIHRVLKPGGIACSWDPLRHNPVINVYRRIAKRVRTRDEHPLDIRVVYMVRKIFSRVTYETFWFASLWIFLRFYFLERVDPNKERYWKKILQDEKRLRQTYLRLEKWDSLIKRIPCLRRFGWNIAIVAEK